MTMVIPYGTSFTTTCSAFLWLTWSHSKGHRCGARPSPFGGHVHYDDLHICGDGGGTGGSSCGACGAYRLGFRGTRKRWLVLLLGGQA
ncbi:hypothetical protein GYH30_009892 [Glycine max]|nr:hypothetical protein GYH30_009892 [Glycine max]